MTTDHFPHADSHPRAAPTPPDLDELRRSLTRLWQRGWHPLDIVRLVESDPIQTRLVADFVTMDRTDWHADADPLWRSQADHIGGVAEPWWNTDLVYWFQFVAARCGGDERIAATNAELVGLCLSMAPELPMIVPPPEQPADGARTSVDDRVLDKVRALLAKAESSTYPSEAESLSAKAQELISRHQIDAALLVGAGSIADALPAGRRIYIDRPYPKPKFALLSSVARANDCRCVLNRGTNTAHLFGFDTDLMLTEMLFTSLLVQGTSAVLRPDETVPPKRVKAWRNAFWAGYAHRIGERLADVQQQSRVDAARTNNRLLPVLAAKTEAVEDVVAEAFPQLGSLQLSVSSAAGADAGRRFANKARLDGGGSVRSGQRPALGR